MVKTQRTESIDCSTLCSEKDDCVVTIVRQYARLKSISKRSAATTTTTEDTDAIDPSASPLQPRITEFKSTSKQQKSDLSRYPPEIRISSELWVGSTSTNASLDREIPPPLPEKPYQLLKQQKPQQHLLLHHHHHHHHQQQPPQLQLQRGSDGSLISFSHIERIAAGGIGPSSRHRSSGGSVISYSHVEHLSASKHQPLLFLPPISSCSTFSCLSPSSHHRLSSRFTPKNRTSTSTFGRGRARTSASTFLTKASIRSKHASSLLFNLHHHHNTLSDIDLSPTSIPVALRPPPRFPRLKTLEVLRQIIRHVKKLLKRYTVGAARQRSWDTISELVFTLDLCLRENLEELQKIREHVDKLQQMVLFGGGLQDSPSKSLQTFDKTLSEAREHIEGLEGIRKLLIHDLSHLDSRNAFNSSPQMKELRTVFADKLAELEHQNIKIVTLVQRFSDLLAVLQRDHDDDEDYD